MLAKDAMKLADILIGLEDAKSDLLKEYKKAMDEDILSQELIDSAERYLGLVDEYADYLDPENLTPVELPATFGPDD
jgi:hypothetical protein